MQLTGINGKTSPILKKSPLVAEGNTVYVQSKTMINAIEADGQLLWAKPAEKYFELPLVALDGNLLGAGETVYSVDKSSGEFSKHFDRGIKIPMLLDYSYDFGIPVQVSEDVLVLQALFNLTSKLDQFDTSESYALALNNEGKELWKTTLPGFSVFEMATGSSGQIFFAGMSQFLAISSKGDLLWTYNVSRGGIHKVVYGSEDCIVFYNLLWKMCHVLDRSGQLVWTKDFSPLKVSHVSISNQGNLLIGLLEPRQRNSPHSMVRFLASFDPQGNELWRKEFTVTGGMLPTVDENDNIFFSCRSGVYSLSSDGSERWKFDLPDCFGQVVIGEDNKLFVFARDGMLHCIGEK